MPEYACGRHRLPLRSPPAKQHQSNAPLVSALEARADSPIKLPIAMLLRRTCRNSFHSDLRSLGFAFSLWLPRIVPRPLLSCFRPSWQGSLGFLSVGKLTQRASPGAVVRVIGVLMLLAGGISAYLPSLVAAARFHGLPFLAPAPVFFLTAAILGSVLPLLCQLSVAADENAGRGVSLIYFSNILGSVLGSLGIGFVLMQYFGLRQISLQLGFATVLTGGLVLILGRQESKFPPVWATLLFVVALVAVPLASPRFDLLYEKLTFGKRLEEFRTTFARVVENRNGVISVTQEAAVFGGGVYDGYFRIDPSHDTNMIIRALVLSAIHPAPKRILMIGLSSGSWGQILANHPQVESLDVVEINPGYLQLIPQYPVVRSFLQNPKVHIFVDDGRRWLIAHPDARYDAIICNSTFFWRDHGSGLLFRRVFSRWRAATLIPAGSFTSTRPSRPRQLLRVSKFFPMACASSISSRSAIHPSRSPQPLAGHSSPIQDRQSHPLRPRRRRGAANPCYYVRFANSINLPPVVVGLEGF